MNDMKENIELSTRIVSKVFKRSTSIHGHIIERITCITLHLTDKFRKKKDAKPSNKNSNEIPSLKDYKSKED
jgi:hypothetical protein